MGLHTISVFTGTLDSYVTPVSHKGLKSTLPGTLESPLDASQTQIVIRSLADPHTLLHPD